MKSLLIASNNSHKQAEIKHILQDLPLRLLTPAELGLDLNVPEDGTNYFENATAKAQAFNLASGLPTLADDSGLEVAALNGAPGVHSNRYAPIPNATDADRRQYLLRNLATHLQPWLASFHCTVVYIDGSGNKHNCHGECPGQIIPQERGSNGFGYDPIFYIPGHKATMAELAEHEKNKISHRARALLAIYPILEKFSYSAL